MKLSCLSLLLALAMANPARAEKLTFDHRTYPPLEAVLDSGRTEMVQFNDSNPNYVTDRIAIQGTSVTHWTEALDIVVRSLKPKMKTAADWAGEIQHRASALCPSTFTTLAQDANSLTFLRQSTGCPAGTAQTGLYRIVAGSKSLFLLNAMTTGEMAEPVQRQWLVLLATAHIDP